MELLQNAQTYSCEKCNYSCKKMSDWDRHIHTKKHVSSKDDSKYECEKCNYVTYNTSDWSKHMKTKKHLCDEPKTYDCKRCNTQFTNYKAHWNHKQKCKEQPNYTNMIETLVRENQDLKTIFANEIKKFVSEHTNETNKILVELTQSNKTLIELANKPTVIQTTNNTQTTHKIINSISTYT